MWGTFQHSTLRIEVDASAETIRQSLLQSEQLQRWLWPQRLMAGMPRELHAGLTYLSWTGPVMIRHQVEAASENRLHLLLSQGIDGTHEWYWGDGWVQSRLEGVSLLPLNLGQSWSLGRLQQFVKALSQAPTSANA